MKPAAWFCLSFFLGLTAAARAQIFQSDATATPLIELYTSEGCSSCPPADRWLGALKDDPGLWTRFVPVAFHVNYWDYLGWKDPFAQPAFTERQRAYAAAWRAGTVYTPAFVNQGREWRPGRAAPDSAAPGILTVERNADGSGTVRFAPASPTKLKTYDASVALLGAGVLIEVRAGENAGRALPHEFVALHLAAITLAAQPDGTFTGRFEAPPVNLPAAPRHALAAWISAPGTLPPLQTTGGWLP